jgi:hypothetical protein
MSLPYFQRPGFWVAILIAYLVTLSLEMAALTLWPAPERPS